MFTTVICLVTLLLTIGQCERQNDINDILLRYYRDSLTDFSEINITQSQPLLIAKGFDLRKMTVFYVLGYLEDLSWENTNVVVQAYLERGDHNIIVVDWTNMNKGNFVFNAFPNTFKVSVALAKSIWELVEAGLDPDKTHLVGHSLGGQIVGFTGQQIFKQKRYKLHRISLLDPAYPGFYEGGNHASKDDAKFTDAIHTDSGIYGATVNTAQVDFWPNGGERSQPGCTLTFLPFFPTILSKDDLCSHWRSWRYWAESLYNETAFPAKKCTIGEPWGKSSMDGRDGYMGYRADSSLYGSYCLVTESQSPFGLGEKGAITQGIK